MAITEVNAHLKYVNSSGDTTVIYPITKMDNVEGIDEIVTSTKEEINKVITSTKEEIEKSVDSIKEKVDTIISSVVPVSSGGTGGTTAEAARVNLGAAPACTYGTVDIVAGSKSTAPNGTVHFVYVAVDGVWDHVKNIFIAIDGVWRLVWDITSSSETDDKNPDSTRYSTTVKIDGTTLFAKSAADASPDINFTVTKTGVEFVDSNAGDKVAYTYDGESVFCGIVYDETVCGIGYSGTIVGTDASDTIVELAVSVVDVNDQIPEPLKFYTLDGSNFTVSTQYVAIPNVEYSYDNLTWIEFGTLSQRSGSLTSQNGTIYLRGTNSTFDVDTFNTRGVGLCFSEPVMCTGDLVSMLSYEGTVDNLDGRCFFGFFVDSTNLLCPPNLPSKVLNGFCYEALFLGCTSMVVNTRSSDGYSREWRVPTTGTAIAVADTNGDTYPPLYMALDGTAGNYKDISVSFSGVSVPGTPDINTTYYIKDLS